MENSISFIDNLSVHRTAVLHICNGNLIGEQNDGEIDENDDCVLYVRK